MSPEEFRSSWAVGGQAGGASQGQPLKPKSLPEVTGEQIYGPYNALAFQAAAGK